MRLGLSHLAAPWRNRPVAVAFLASILLSAVAVGTGTLNRDGMLYAETAKAFLDGGLPAAKAVFPWPFLSVLMASLSTVTHLPVYLSGHLLNTVFMAVSCALAVDFVRRKDPRLAWPAVLVVLSLPGLNDYRNELIREYGAWCFTMLALHLSSNWPQNPSWRRALLIQASLCIAVLFRPETAVFFPCIVFWQFFQSSPVSPLKRAGMLGSLPLLALLLILGTFISGAIPETSRVAQEIRRFDFSRFDHTAREMSEVFNAYARDDAQTAPLILFFGSLAIIPWKFLGKLGVFLLPAIAFLNDPTRKYWLRRYDLMVWAFIGHLLILSVFAVQNQFVSGRYFGPLLLFSVPFIACSLYRLFSILPRCRWPIVALLGVLAVLNVFSFTPPKRHFQAAGQWLAAHYPHESPRVFLGSPRTAHYAGWSYSTRTNVPDLQQLAQAVGDGRYDLVILEVSPKDGRTNAWLHNNCLHEIRRFADTNGSAVVVAEVSTQRTAPPSVAASDASKPAKTRPCE